MDKAIAKAVLEALLFGSDTPIEESELQSYLKGGLSARDILEELRADYNGRGICLERAGSGWAFRTASSIAPYLTKTKEQNKRLTKAGLETLAIIAYRQPVTRAEIEEIRGVPVQRGTLDLLTQAGWIVPKGRKETPGRPVTWVTTLAFLDYFALSDLSDLPRLDEIEASGLFKPDPASV